MALIILPSVSYSIIVISINLLALTGRLTIVAAVPLKSSKAVSDLSNVILLFNALKVKNFKLQNPL